MTQYICRVLSDTNTPEASLLEKIDLIHELQLGYIIGGFTGVILAMTAFLSGMIVQGCETVSIHGRCSSISS